MKIPYHAAVTVHRETTVTEAAELMDREGIGSLLVTEDDTLVGIVTDRDLAVRVVARQIPFDGRVDAVMTCGVVTVPATAGRTEVIELLREHSIRRLPVVGDDGRLVGVVTLDDLFAIATPRDLPGLAAAVTEEVRHPHHDAHLPVPARGSAPHEPRIGRRQARVGDQLVVHGHLSNQPVRDGEILSVNTPAGDPPFLVRWSDDGHVSFIYPGPDAEIRHLGDREPAHS